MSATISVIVPAYNAENYLDKTVESVLAQSRTDWELIIVDDGSQDATRQIAQRYAEQDERIRVLCSKNGGVSQARNIGYAQSDPRTRAVIFLDADDVWQPYALETLADLLERNPGLVAAHGVGHCIDRDGACLPEDSLYERHRNRLTMTDGILTPLPPERPTDYASLLVYNWALTPGVLLIRRSALERLETVFDVSLPHGAEDWELALRLARLSPFAFTGLSVIGYRRHEGNVTNHARRMSERAMEVRRRLFAESDKPEYQRLAWTAFRLRTRHTVQLHRRMAFDALRRGQAEKAARQARFIGVTCLRYYRERRRARQEGWLPAA